MTEPTPKLFCNRCDSELRGIERVLALARAVCEEKRREWLDGKRAENPQFAAWQSFETQSLCVSLVAEMPTLSVEFAYGTRVSMRAATHLPDNELRAYVAKLCDDIGEYVFSHPHQEGEAVAFFDGPRAVANA